MTRAFPWLVALALAPVAPAAEPAFRGGDGRFASATAPATWDASTTAWRVPTEAWSNASPVPFADMVCALSEPVAVWCVDAATGALRWRADNDYRYTLSPEARPDFEAQERAAREAAEALPELRTAYSRTRRELRRSPGDPTLTAALERLGGELASTKARLEAHRPYDTPPDRELIGWSTATPTTDGERLFVLTGQGVVTAWTAEGTRAWSVWLGPPASRMRGYTVGTSASPRLVDGVLVVPHGQLVGLDPATGRTLWRGPTWADYGTPTPARLDGAPVVLTPEGQAVSAKDGTILAEGLGDVWFTSPVVQDDRAWWVGGFTAHEADRGRGMRATSWDLSTRPPSPRFDVALPIRSPIYGTPVLHEGGLWVVDTASILWRIDADTGQTERIAALGGDATLGQVFASPVLVGERLATAGQSGHVSIVDPGPPAREVAVHTLGAMRATPWADARGVFLRTLDALVHLEAP